MSIHVMAQVWKNGPTKSADRMMLLAVADNADDDGLAWPGIATLAAKCCVSESAARRTIRRLETDGWLTVTTGGGGRGGHGIPNRYQIDLARLVNPGVHARDVEEHPGRGRAEDPGVDARRTLASTPGEPSIEPPKRTPSPPHVAVAPSGDVDLFGAEVVPITKPRTAGDLVAAYIEGWTCEHPEPPDKSFLDRVKGNLARMAKQRTDERSWRRALDAARQAGREGRWDPVACLAPRPGVRAEPEPWAF